MTKTAEKQRSCPLKTLKKTVKKLALLFIKAPFDIIAIVLPLSSHLGNSPQAVVFRLTRPDPYFNE